MVGSAILRRLALEGFENVVAPSSKELDLRDQRAVEAFFGREKPEYVFLAAARVGGVQANIDSPADFLYDNLMIEMNVINAAFRHRTKRLLLVASAAVYPRNAEQPLREESLLTAPYEPTNEAYGIAKTAGMKYCEYLNRQHETDFLSVTPTNMYGPGDNYDPVKSHVVPGMVRRFHEAKASGASEVVIWGTGSPVRDFLHSDDMAAACMLLMREFQGSGPVNVASGHAVSIAELAKAIGESVGFRGEIRFDPSKPDGAPMRAMDISILRSMGWAPKIPLVEGLSAAYRDYLAGETRAER